MTGQPLTNDISPANCSVDDNSITWIHTAVSAASGATELCPSCQNDVLNLSEDSVVQSSHCSEREVVEDESFDGGTLTLRVESTTLPRMKRADSLPSSLLWYVLPPETPHSKILPSCSVLNSFFCFCCVCTMH